MRGLFLLLAQDVLKLYEPVAIIERQVKKREHWYSEDSRHAEFLVIGPII